MKKFKISDIEIRNDVDQKLAHKNDSPNKKKQKKKYKIRHCELGYYIVGDNEQSSIDSSNAKLFFENDDGEMIEIKPTRMSNIPKELIPSNWK